MACTNVHSNAMIAWRSKHSILPIRKGTLQPSVYIHYHIWYIGISHAFSNFYICLCTPYFDIRCTYVYIRLRIHTRARLQQVTCTCKLRDSVWTPTWTTTAVQVRAVTIATWHEVMTSLRASLAVKGWMLLMAALQALTCPWMCSNKASDAFYALLAFFSSHASHV